MAENWEETIDADMTDYFAQAREDDNPDAYQSNMLLARPLVLEYKSKVFMGALWNTILAFKKFRSARFFTLKNLEDFFYVRAQKFHALALTYGGSVLELHDQMDTELIATIRPQDMLEAGPFYTPHLMYMIGNPKAEDAAVLAAWEYSGVEFNMYGYSERVRKAYEEMFQNFNKFLIKQLDRPNIGTSLKLMLAFTLMKKGIPDYFTWDLVKTHLITPAHLERMELYLRQKGFDSFEVGRTIYTEVGFPGGTGRFDDEVGRILSNNNRSMPGLLGFIAVDIVSSGLEYESRKGFHKMTTCLDYNDPNY